MPCYNSIPVEGHSSFWEMAINCFQSIVMLSYFLLLGLCRGGSWASWLSYPTCTSPVSLISVLGFFPGFCANYFNPGSSLGDLTSVAVVLYVFSPCFVPNLVSSSFSIFMFYHNFWGFKNIYIYTSMYYVDLSAVTCYINNKLLNNMAKYISCI